MRFRDSWYFQTLQPEMATIAGPGDLPGHFQAAADFMAGLPADRGGFAYAPGKWTLSQVLGHMLDAQLVMMNRVLFIARGETRPLPGFDENVWVRSAGHEQLSIAQVRGLYLQSSALWGAVIAGLPAGALKKTGIANELEITCEEILVYIMAHEKHHMGVIGARYLED